MRPSQHAYIQQLSVLLLSDPLTQVPPSHFPVFLLRMSQDTHALYNSPDLVIFSAVDFKLNPVSAVSNIVVSEDQRQVRPAYPFKSSNMQPHDIFTLDVLGCQYFSSGKYYWEVDVSEKNAWILGVYSKNVSKEKLKLNESSPFLGRRYRPDIGYWVIGLQNKYEYKVFENSSVSSLQIWTPFITIPLCRVGVFLEFEAGTVSFFNVTNHGSLIYKFSNCYFSKATYPFFNLGNCCAPLTVCRPSS